MASPPDVPVKPLLEIRHLAVDFEGVNGRVRVVDEVSITVPRGRVVALVGESGCGKSVTALSILGLLPRPAARACGGEILFHGLKGPVDLLRLGEREWRAVRGRHVAMIFQETMAALNPVFTIGEQIVESLVVHQELAREEAISAVVRLLAEVGIDDPRRRASQYPHQFSGGMRQRAMIAMALAGKPQLLIADEPTTALDVTVQAQILDLLLKLQAETHLSMLLITHDLGVVARTADYVYVMYAGRIVEHAPSETLFARPLHPYTRALFACTPRIDEVHAGFEGIRGLVPDPAHYPAGCRFHPRCEATATAAAMPGRYSLVAQDDRRVLRRCVEAFAEEPSGVPGLREGAPGHWVSCWEACP